MSNESIITATDYNTVISAINTLSDDTADTHASLIASLQALAARLKSRTNGEMIRITDDDWTAVGDALQCPAAHAREKDRLRDLGVRQGIEGRPGEMQCVAERADGRPLQMSMPDVSWVRDTLIPACREDAHLISKLDQLLADCATVGADLVDITAVVAASQDRTGSARI